MALIEATAEASSAEIFARSRLGIAIAAMINMIATTISSSIKEKPFSRLIRCLNSWQYFKVCVAAVKSGGKARPLAVFQYCTSAASFAQAQLNPNPKPTNEERSDPQSLQQKRRRILAP